MDRPQILLPTISFFSDMFTSTRVLNITDGSCKSLLGIFFSLGLHDIAYKKYICIYTGGIQPHKKLKKG